MWHIGVDAHKKRCFLVAKDDAGNLVLKRTFEHTREGWRSALSEAPKGSRVAFECVGWYGLVVDLIRTIGLEPVLVNARNVHLIAKSKRKTDAHDAETLCDLLRSGFLPTAYAPDKAVRELRELTRHHDDLVKTTIRLKNTVHRLLERAWVEAPAVTDLFGKLGRSFLHEVDVSPSQRLVLDQLLAQLDANETLRRSLEAVIAQHTQADEDVQLLLTIDGLGPMACAALKAEVGNVHRFTGRKQIRMNFGLAPSVRASADTEHRGHITKQGQGIVRKYTVQGVPHYLRHNPAAKVKHDRLRRERGNSVARVAIAADILDVAYQVLRTRTPYRHGRRLALAKKRRKFRYLTEAATTT